MTRQFSDDAYYCYSLCGHRRTLRNKSSRQFTADWI